MVVPVTKKGAGPKTGKSFPVTQARLTAATLFRAFWLLYLKRRHSKSQPLLRLRAML